MRHLKRGRKLNRNSTHRKAMLRNLVSSLFLHGRVTTTPAKAKEARPFAERLITLAKRNTLHSRRRAISLLHNEKIVASLFNEIGPRYKERPGGYCRILHLAKVRVGDAAPQAIFELVEEEFQPKAKKAKADSGTPPVAEAPQEESKAEETPAATEASPEEPKAEETSEEEDKETKSE